MTTLPSSSVGRENVRSRSEGTKLKSARPWKAAENTSKNSCVVSNVSRCVTALKHFSITNPSMHPWFPHREPIQGLWAIFLKKAFSNRKLVLSLVGRAILSHSAIVDNLPTPPFPFPHPSSHVNIDQRFTSSYRRGSESARGFISASGYEPQGFQSRWDTSVPADLDPAPRFRPPGPYPPANLDPPGHICWQIWIPWSKSTSRFGSPRVGPSSKKPLSNSTTPCNYLLLSEFR